MNTQQEIDRQILETAPTDQPLNDIELAALDRERARELSKSESAHTPGPWTLIGEDGDGDYAILGNERPSNSGKVTSAGPITISDEVAFIQTENFANARLIAAAPETAAERDYFAKANNEEQIRNRKLQHALGEVEAERDRLREQVEAANRDAHLYSDSYIETRGKLHEVEKQRDELLAACRAVISDLEQCRNIYGDSDCIDNVRAAIKHAEGAER